MKKLLNLILFLMFTATGILAKEYQITSPDGKIKSTVSVKQTLIITPECT